MIKSNTVSVLFFATLHEQAGVRQLDLELEVGVTVQEFKRVLGEHLPSLQPTLGTCLTAINQEYAFPEDLIPTGAEIALFPPVSGG